jgi:TRAP-type mannitol/chloroaromatic compound transport system substrate-binding protein
MKRRGVLKAGVTGAAVAGAVAGLAAPALSQGRVEWRMVTSWPRNLPGTGSGANKVAERIGQATGGRITVRVFAAGEVVPAFGVFDAVSQGTVDLYHSTPHFWFSRSRAASIIGSFPFGLMTTELTAWLRNAGGQAMWDELYARFNLKPFLCGNSGPQWSGFFRRELATPDDLRGLRFRAGGLVGGMYQRLGASVVQMPVGEVFQALQAGTIDAAEFAGPWADGPLGFGRVARFYYRPCGQEPSASLETVINKPKFDALPDDLKAAVRFACEGFNEESVAEWDHFNPQALRQIVETQNVQVRSMPEPIVRAMAEAAATFIRELREDPDALNKRIIESYIGYRNSAVGYVGEAYAPVHAGRAMVAWG